MTRLPFDPGNPPAEPPPGCVSPTIWRLAYALHSDHRSEEPAAPTDPGPFHRCRCGEEFPCRSRRAAERGLLQAFGLLRAARQPDLIDPDPWGTGPATGLSR